MKKSTKKNLQDWAIILMVFGIFGAAFFVWAYNAVKPC